MDTIKKLSLFIVAILIFAALPVLVFAQERDVQFHNFPWGTSFEDFTAVVGEPGYIDEVNGLKSAVFEGVQMAGFPAFMVAFFSEKGLQGGAYYFITNSIEELMDCYTTVQAKLLGQFGPTLLFEELMREMRIYETSWDLPTGYIYLRVNTRWWNEPVTLWFSSPELTRMLRGS